MSILCFIQGHSPSDEQIWNRGYSFSRCRRCRCDMIRSDSQWQAVPRGHRVVWKGGLHEHSRPAGYVRNLPVLYRDSVRSGVPAHWQAGGWYSRILAIVGGGVGSGVGGGERLSAPAAAVALDYPEPDLKPFPYLVALAAVAGAGLQLLLAERSGREG